MFGPKKSLRASIRYVVTDGTQRLQIYNLTFLFSFSLQATYETELRLQDHICKIFLKRKKKGEPIKCEICHKLFKRMCTLKHHLATVHVEEKPFQCDMCDYKAKAARFVFRHKQQVHDKILPHVCHVCGKGFFTAFMMKNHMANVHNRYDFKQNVIIFGHITSTLIIKICCKI